MINNHNFEFNALMSIEGKSKLLGSNRYIYFFIESNHLRECSTE